MSGVIPRMKEAESNMGYSLLSSRDEAGEGDVTIDARTITATIAVGAYLSFHYFLDYQEH